MIQFEDSYFEGETRDGFYIEPMMKRCWAAQMEVLADIDKVCKKHNITYFADWGTLLGAVRHHGFIPWDDDLDIAMRREDFVKFNQVAAQELPENYHLHNMHTDIKEGNFLNRVVNSTSIQVDEEFLKRYHGFPYVAGIDIFPLDYLPQNEDERNTLKDLIKFVAGAGNMITEETTSEEQIGQLLSGIESLCGVKLNRNMDRLHLQNQLNRLIEKLFMMYGKEECEWITSMVHYFMWDWDYRVSKSFYESVIWMPFENIEVPVPIGYETILRIKYGADYMTPRKAKAGHDYPYYKDQREILRNWLVENHIPAEQFDL